MILETVGAIAGGAAFAIAGAVAVVRVSRRRAARTVPVPAPAPRVNPVPTVKEIVRTNGGTAEGLEIRYDAGSLVRSVRVGAMNCEHKELLLTMDGTRWKTLTNAGKQEVLAAARSTWAAKMCPSGPDIAYVVIETEKGEIVGRADPRSVTIA